MKNCTCGTASMMKIRPSAAGMNSPSTLRRANRRCRARKRRTGPLVARQQVGVFAGHHAFAALGHPGAAGGLLGPAFFALTAWGRAVPCAVRLASAVVIGAGATGPRRRAGLAAFGRGPALRGGVPRTPFGVGSRCPAGRARTSSAVVVAAQQLHVCQVTSRPSSFDAPVQRPNLLA